jgi:hypothetical protein
MSASKMRAAAAANDLNLFKQGVPNQEVADEMFAAVRKGMGVRDEVPVAAEDATTPKKAFIEEKLKTVKFKIAQSEARVAQLEAMLQKAQQA